MDIFKSLDDNRRARIENIPPKVLFQPLSSTNLGEFRGRPRKAIKNIKFAP